jgi:hypothetical protein
MQPREHFTASTGTLRRGDRREKHQIVETSPHRFPANTCTFTNLLIGKLEAKVLDAMPNAFCETLELRIFPTNSLLHCFPLVPQT